MNSTFLNLADHRLAYQHLEPQTGKKSVCFLGGYASDMTGSKASFLAERCTAHGLGFTRFDYRGHGTSSGDFAKLTLSDWLDDATQILTQIATGPQILVGSSMGGWIALLLSQKFPERISALIGIAAAPDFTEELMWKNFDKATKKRLETDGFIIDPDAPEEIRKPITMDLILDGRHHLLLNNAINISCPIRLLQGLDDTSVPWSHALRIAEQINHDNVQIKLVKGGDHRLSTPQNLELLWQSIAEFL